MKKDINAVIDFIRSVFFITFVRHWAEDWSASSLKEQNMRFKIFPHCSYSVGVYFQYGFRPVGSRDDQKPYFSLKHKLYGFESEFSLFPNGLCILLSCYQKGRVSEIAILCESIQGTKTCFKNAKSMKTFRSMLQMVKVTTVHRASLLINDISVSNMRLEHSFQSRNQSGAAFCL